MIDNNHIILDIKEKRKRKVIRSKFRRLCPYSAGNE